MLLVTAAGILLKNNLERIGPLALAVLMGLAAAACYGWAWTHRTRASVVDDAILLLGALLFSGDVAFVETQFHLFGEAWVRHFLIVAAVHAVGAYAYRSRALLSLAITAAAAWLGVRGIEDLDSTDYAIRAAACSALTLAWRRVNHREEFHGTLEHFASLFAILASFALMFDDDLRLVGCFLAIVVSAAIIAWGFRTRREPFVFYGFLAAVIAFDALLVELLNEDVVILLVLVLSAIGSVVALIAIHGRFREATR